MAMARILRKSFFSQLILISSALSFCFDTDSFTTQDKYLTNSLLGTTTTSNVIDCAAACQFYLQCRSFGFEPQTYSCHLHGTNSDLAPANLIQTANWSHGNVNVWPKTIWNACDDVTCPWGHSCRLNRITGHEACFKFVPSEN